MTSLSIAWRAAFVVSVSIALGHAFWLAADIQSAERSPTWARASLDLLSLAAWAVLVTIVVKIWRLRPSRIELPPTTNIRTVFTPKFPWFWEYVVWAMGPSLLFSALFIGRMLALSTLATAGLAGFMLLNWLVLFLVLRIRYEVTDEALAVKRMLFGSERIRWSDLKSLQIKAVGYGEHLVLERTEGRRLRLVAPAAREEFIQALRNHAPAAIVRLA